jgi:alpha-beta hydrolase superfamily lysophospholipase
MPALYSRAWPPVGKTTAHLIIVHGYAEHCGRYAALARAMNEVGVHVHAWDHRGHGESPGRPGRIERLDALVADLGSLAERVETEADGRPVFVLGHSMGGLILAHYLATTPLAIRGAIFSSPLLAIPGHVSPLLLRISRWLGRIAPGLPVERLDSRGIAQDPAVVQAYDHDPRIYHGAVRARTGAELVRAIQALEGMLPRITVPFLLFHGTADRIAPLAGSERLFLEGGSTDKEFFRVEGGYHELLNDSGREEVIRKILDWLRHHRA